MDLILRNLNRRFPQAGIRFHDRGDRLIIPYSIVGDRRIHHRAHHNKHAQDCDGRNFLINMGFNLRRIDGSHR